MSRGLNAIPTRRLCAFAVSASMLISLDNNKWQSAS